MRTKKLLLVLLVSSLIMLAACAPEATQEKPKEPLMSTEVSYPYPAPRDDEAVQPTDQEEPYPAPQEIITDRDPYPGVEKEAIQPADPYEPYPAPQEVITGKDPYPSVEIVGNTSDRDLSEAIRSPEFAIQSSDNSLQTESVFIENNEIVIKESYPVQVELIISGYLPTPCHQLRVIYTEPDDKGHIEVEAYSVSDPEKMCSQVLKPFIAVVPLGEYTEGTFTLSVNDEINGEFNLP